MSLFKRPAWAQTQDSEDEEDDINLFSHSSRSYAEIVAEEQRAKKERAEKERLKQEKKNVTRIVARKKKTEKGDQEDGKRESLEKRATDEDVKRGSAKRRRITLEEGEDLLGSVGLSPMVMRNSGAEVGDGDEPGDLGHSLGLRRSPRSRKVVNVEETSTDGPSRAAPADTTRDRSDWDDEVQIQQILPRQPSEGGEAARHDDNEDDESDDEFAELARQARARRRLQEAAKKMSHTPDAQSPDPPGADARDGGRHTYPTPPQQRDPTVKLFITSPIPDTTPLIVYRKLSQRLQEIREVWCQKQNFSPAEAHGVFLIHRMRRVYDVTTCRSLGLDVGPDGETIIMKGEEDGVDGVEQVHLEAVTDAIFAQLHAQKADEERKRHGLRTSAGGLGGGEDDENEDEDVDAGTGDARRRAKSAEASQPLIRIFLKTRDSSEPMKLKVKAVSLFLIFVHI